LVQILDQLKIRATKNDDQKDSRSQQNLISAEVESFAAKPSQFLTGYVLRVCLSVVWPDNGPALPLEMRYAVVLYDHAMRGAQSHDAGVAFWHCRPTPMMSIVRGRPEASPRSE
jgi:hypothetical protein